MFLRSLDLTTALRPELLPDETLLFVQDGVGLYEGKFKLPDRQHGHAYLTSHRICYVDNYAARKNSIAIELKSVDRYEFYAGFLKSSAKITLYPKPLQRLSVQARNQLSFHNPYLPNKSSSSGPLTLPSPRGSPLLPPVPSSPNDAQSRDSTWVCSICSFSNLVPSNFDASSANALTPLPPCLACGIKPSLAHILKATISNASARQPSPGPSRLPTQQLLETQQQYHAEAADEPNENNASGLVSHTSQSSFQCPRCTFLNHPSLRTCELCGAALLSVDSPKTIIRQESSKRSESPGPTLDTSGTSFEDMLECVKFSFRAGGDKIFYERLKAAMVQRKWLLHNAPPIPLVKAASYIGSGGRLSTKDGHNRIIIGGGGISGLERRGNELRMNNQAVIGNAFEDLEALMASAKEIVALAETFASKSADDPSDASALVTESAAALGMVTTKDMLGQVTGSDTLYLSELSRNLAEYLTDDRQGILRREGGIVSLVDLWAMFNRARNGVELISPLDFEKAARLWEKLGLPIRLREFRNGLLVVQRHDWTDEKTISQLLDWLKDLHVEPVAGEVGWDWKTFGRGVTVQEAAAKFGWSVGVASEELEIAEEKGVICREEGVEGVRFWENWMLNRQDSNDTGGHISRLQGIQARTEPY